MKVQGRKITKEESNYEKLLLPVMGDWEQVRGRVRYRDVMFSNDLSIPTQSK